MNALLLALGVVLLSGCAATPSDFTAAEAKRAATVRAYPASAFAPPHTVIGTVRSNTCDGGSFKRYPNTQGEALWLLKLATVRRGGDVVVGYSCRMLSVDPLSVCLGAKRCQGKAAILD